MEQTLNRIFRERVARYGDRTAIEKKQRGAWIGATWNEYYERARALGLGLHSRGIRKGDRVSLLSENRLEWLYCDMGCLGIGACVVPVYTTLPAEEVEFIAENSGSRVLIVENRAQLDKAQAVLDRCPDLELVVAIEGNDISPADRRTISLASIMDEGRGALAKDPSLFETLADSVGFDDLATIVYTSGTTGLPKGAMISHRNIVAVVEALHRIEPHYAFDTDQTVPFLPLSHVFERVAGHFYGMYVGITASYAESIDTLLQDFLEKRPTVILAVPRVCEKVYQKIINQVEEQSAFKQKIFFWGQKIGAHISELREQKKPIPAFLNFRYRIAYRLIFSKLMEKLGGRVRWMTASGAPTAREIILFFNSAGIMVIQGYGMTECTAPATMQNIADYRIGTTGKPIPCCEIKIADDGEILIRGENVISGYWRMEEETKECFNSEGFFMSGDIGYFDDAGFLVITDRKKDLIITSGGKNVAPQKIENLFKSDPLFTQFIVVGEKKKYLAALCNINMDQAVKIAAEKGIPCADPRELLASEKFLQVVQEHVDERNRHLAKYETIKRFAVVEKEFSQESGELTPSLKVKRKVVQEKYAGLINGLYAREAADDLA